MPEPLLHAAGVEAGYGHVTVLRGVELTVAEGERVAVVGANGAGKSTLLRTLAGLLPVRAGSVAFGGTDVTRLAAERRVRAGLALVPEGRRLFGPMSVEENLRLGAYSCRPTAEEYAAAIDRVGALFPVLCERLGQPASTLSGGEQQMLAIGRALMSRPRLLLLDEPSLGLAPKVVRDIFAALDALAAEGTTLLVVEQDARMALKHADRGYVMRSGAVALEGAAGELLSNDDVRLIYLGARGAQRASGGR